MKKDGGVVIWVLVLLALFVVGVQLHHRGLLPGQTRKQATKPCSPFPPDKAGTVTIFGHEFSQADVEAWYSKVTGRYCWNDGAVFAVGTGSGQPLTYRQFVCALKQGFYFPELKGVGLKSEGERVVLTHESLSRHPRKQARAIQPDAGVHHP
ncbi:MAG: hypothetical protein V1873_00075 [Verrucomicrobiota bacterium]